jgi:hypothetical protein
MKRLVLKACILIPIALVLLVPEQLRGSVLPNMHSAALLSQVQRAPFQDTAVTAKEKEFVRSESNHRNVHDVARRDGCVYLDGDPRLRAIIMLESNPVAQASVDDARTPIKILIITAPALFDA